ncbi:MAG: serine protease [Thermomicrobiales bacterium]
MENRSLKEPAGPTWQQRCAGLMALVLVFSLLLEGATARDVSARPATDDLPVQAEIIGGSKAPIRDFPFMAFVLAGSSLCGGTLIDPDSVLTAAHCVTDPEGNIRAPSAFTLYIGKGNVKKAKKSNRYGVTAVFRHPDYDANTFQNDVAVLKLNRNVVRSRRLPSSTLAQPSTGSAGQSVVVAGWGTTSVNKIKISLQLRMTNLTVNSQATCEADYPGDFDNATMMCASSPGRDSCQGDSGGPLLGRVQTGTTPVVVKGKKHKGKKRKKKHIEAAVYSSTQVGVVSWGYGCAVEGKPGVYARLSEPGINSFVNTSAAQ